MAHHHCHRSPLDISALVTLADKDLAKEARVSEKLPEHLKKIMEQRLANREQEKAEKAADSIIAVLDAAEDRKLKLVQQIREARNTIKSAQAELNSIDVAIEYGNATSNYMPLVGKVANENNLMNLNIDPSLMYVPDSFKSPKPKKR